MAKSQLKPMPYLGRPEGPSDGLPRVWKWVILSGIAHLVVVTVVLIAPIFGPKNTPPPPVYTVDLMGGEKLGAGAGTSLNPVPAPKPEQLAPEEKSAPPQETKKANEAPKPTPQEIKEAKAKAAADARAEMIEKVKAKKEAEEKRRKEAEDKRLADERAEAERRARLEDLNKKRKEAALADLRAKLEERQRQQALEEKLQQQRLLEQQRAAEQQKAAQQQATSTVAGDHPGAAGPGVGGTGGGVVKSPEFIRYQNIIKEQVKSSWTWVGRRTDLKVTVNASIQENGEITGLKLVGTSGDRSFDDSVLRALRKASPLPPPPAEFRREFSNVILPFNSEELGR